MPLLKDDFNPTLESNLNHSWPPKSSTIDPQTIFLEKITQIIPGMVAVYNIHSGQYIFINDALTKILGYSKDSILKGGINFVISHTHPDDLKQILEKNDRAIKQANSHRKNNPIATFEYRIKHKNGKWKWLHTTGIIFNRNKLGKVENVLNISIDITRRKEKELRETAKRQLVENDLRQNEQRFRALLEHSTDAITLLDQFGNRVYATPSRRNILGYDGNEDFGRSVFEYIHPEDKVEVFKKFKQILAQPKYSQTMVFRIRHQQGHYIWIEAVGTNLLHISHLEAVVVNYRDITQRKEAELRQQFLEQATNILISSIDYETTLKNIASLIVPQLADYFRIVILEGDQSREISINHINPQKLTLVKKLYDRYKDSAKNTPGIDKILQTGQSELIPVLTLDHLKPFQTDHKVLNLLKKLQINSYMGVPLKARGKIIGAMTFSSTRPDVVYTEDNLYLAQELAYRIALAIDNALLYANLQNAVKLRDQFISTASHELKTPITSIKGYVQLAQQQTSSPKSEYYLNRADDQMSRLTGLINNLLDVSKIQQGKLDLNLEKLELNQFLKEIVEDLQPLTCNHQIKFKETQPINFQADKFRLHQVFTNLLTNAIKYSPHTKRVQIKISRQKKKILISFRDFGIGIEKKNLPRIFDPFYQVETNMRQSNGGLGLGLHISQQIIRRHGGEIQVESQKNKGSTFTVVLPIK